MNPAPPASEKEARLAARMLSLGIREEELVETFVRGAGPGGQKINKTSSCVSLAYPAMDIRVKCQASRSLTLNRYRAREELCERVAAILLGEKTRAQQEAERIRRQKRRRSRRQKQRMLDAKHAHAEIKANRKPVDW